MPCVATDLHRDYIFIPNNDEAYSIFLRAYNPIRALEQEFAGPQSKGYQHYQELAAECQMIFGQKPFFEVAPYPEPHKLLNAVLQLVKVERKILTIATDSQKMRLVWTDKWLLTEQSESLSEEGFVFTKNDFSMWPEYIFYCKNTKSTCYLFGDMKEFEEDAMMAMLKTEANS